MRSRCAASRVVIGRAGAAPKGSAGWHARGCAARYAAKSMTFARFCSSISFPLQGDYRAALSGRVTPSLA